MDIRCSHLESKYTVADRHISFSAFAKYHFCPNSYKIRYIDKAPRTPNIFSVFGKACHAVCEAFLEGRLLEADAKTFFLQSYKDLAEEEELDLENLDDKLQKMYEHMLKVGHTISILAVKAILAKFKIKRIVAVEEELLEPVFHPDKELENDYDFKGYVDLVFETEDGQWIILDWKTCGWGWNAKKKSDKFVQYQLTYYKHFLALKYDIDPEKIKETYFVLMKRTAFKKDGTPKDNIIEFVKVTCGKKKVQNALKVLNNTMYNIDRGIFPKNKTKCEICDYHKTQWCSG